MIAVVANVAIALCEPSSRELCASNLITRRVATDAAAIFTVVTLIKSFSPYINNLLIYERVLKRNMNKSLVLFLCASPHINV